MRSIDCTEQVNIEISQVLGGLTAQMIVGGSFIVTRRVAAGTHCKKRCAFGSNAEALSMLEATAIKA